jgi:hypothetical protein
MMLMLMISPPTHYTLGDRTNGITNVCLSNLVHGYDTSRLDAAIRRDGAPSFWDGDISFGARWLDQITENFFDQIRDVMHETIWNENTVWESSQLYKNARVAQR